MNIALTGGAISAIAFILGAIAWKKGSLTQAVPWLMLIAGVGIGGGISSVLIMVAGASDSVASGATRWATGAGITFAAALIVGIFLALSMPPWGRPTKFTPLLALIFPSLLAVSTFGFLVATANDWLNRAAVALSAVLGSAPSWLGGA